MTTNKHNFKPSTNEVYDKQNPPPEIFEKGRENIEFRKERIREFRKEASRKASMANKRIQRLEKNNLKDSPAYKRWIADGGEKFSVRGKTYNEVQSMVAKLNRFISSETSTVRGTVNTLKEMAENTGIKYKNLEELKAKSTKFFELHSKVEQYLRTVDDMASAIGYQKIWEAISEYTEQAEIDLADTTLDIETMVEMVTKAIKNVDEPVPTVSGWYSLKKDDL